MPGVQSDPMPRKSTTARASADELFRRNISAMRAELDLSREEASHRIGCSAKYLDMLEKGERKIPRWEILSRIAKAYGRKVEDLMADKPPAADREIMPYLTYKLELSDEERQLVGGDELAKFVNDLMKIDQRIRERVREAREARGRGR